MSMVRSLHKRSFTSGFLKVVMGPILSTLYIQQLSEVISQNRCVHICGCGGGVEICNALLN